MNPGGKYLFQKLSTEKVYGNINIVLIESGALLHSFVCFCLTDQIIDYESPYP